MLFSLEETSGFFIHPLGCTEHIFTVEREGESESDGEREREDCLQS